MRIRSEERSGRWISAGRGSPAAAAMLAASIVICMILAPTAGAAGNGGRVDLEPPTFSNPTTITNPLFPKDAVSQVIQLGVEAGDRVRFEVTQLPDTKFIEWDGKRVETRVTQFVAYSNGRILEVAVDFFAQADDGSVWYFGENVDNYDKGVIADHEGTWLAGKDGPPGMIMPADPQVGDVFRPENIPGLVFEEVTVRRTGLTVAGPRGQVSDAVAVREWLMDGSTEDKIYVPGYGEFRARVASPFELYNVAVATPIDSLDGSVPSELSTIEAGTAKVFVAAASKRWHEVAAAVQGMSSAWSGYQAGDVPPLLGKQMTAALRALGTAAAAKSVAEVQRASIEIGQAVLDLELQFRPSDEVDQDRLAVWRRQLALDRAAGDAAAIKGDVATLETIHDRIHLDGSC